MPQIAVLGPPVSGKWCVANKISKAVRAPHLDPETIIQDAPKELKLEVERYTNEKQVCSGIPLLCLLKL